MLEHKSTTDDITPGGDYWRRVVAMDQQVSHYIGGMRAVGYDIVGAMYDAIRMPLQEPSKVPVLDPDGVKIVLNAAGDRQRTKDGKRWRQAPEPDSDQVLQTVLETPEAFERRVLTVIAEDFGRYYQRQRVVRLAKELHESAWDSWQTAATMRMAMNAKVFPRNPDSCMRYNRACEYLPICCGESSTDDLLLYRKAERNHEELESANRDSRVLLTKSSLSCFRACPRQYELRYVIGLRYRRVANTLRRGNSIHQALNAWWGKNGDLDAALAALVTDDVYEMAKWRAVIKGYHAYWGAPSGRVVAIEQEFVTDLLNPDTGAKSRTFAVAGKADGVIEVQE